MESAARLRLLTGAHREVEAAVLRPRAVVVGEPLGVDAGLQQRAVLQVHGISLHPEVRIGFLAHARKYQEALGAGELIAPAKTVGDMHRIIVNDYVNSTLTAAFLFVVVTMVVYGVLACLKAYRNNRPTVREYPEAHDLTAADDAADIARA
jgi:hypothetical protein